MGSAVLRLRQIQPLRASAATRDDPGLLQRIAAHLSGTPPILTRRYWDQPSPRERGDRDPKLVCEAVGHAVGQWNLADQALANLFVVLSDADSGKNCCVVSRAYYSVQRHGDRRRAIKASAAASFSQYHVRKVVRILANATYDKTHPSHVLADKAALQSATKTAAAVERATNRYDDITHGGAHDARRHPTG